jgi:hypothetical protein
VQVKVELIVKVFFFFSFLSARNLHFITIASSTQRKIASHSRCKGIEKIKKLITSLKKRAKRENRMKKKTNFNACKLQSRKTEAAEHTRG